MLEMADLKSRLECKLESVGKPRFDVQSLSYIRSSRFLLLFTSADTPCDPYIREVTLSPLQCAQ